MGNIRLLIEKRIQVWQFFLPKCIEKNKLNTFPKHISLHTAAHIYNPDLCDLYNKAKIDLLLLSTVQAPFSRL